MKLKTRIQFLSTVLLLVMLILTNCAIYVLFDKMAMDAEIKRIERQVQSMMTALNADQAQETEPENLIRGYLPAGGMIRIIDAQAKEKIIAAADASFRQFNPQFHQKQTVREAHLGNRHIAAVSMPMIWRDGSVVNLEVVHDISAMDQNLNQLKVVLFAATLLILLPAFFAAKMLSRMILNPIHAMMETMEAIQRSKKYQKINLEKESKDELHAMGLTFNQMMDTLQDNYEKQHQFVSDASHELKTPLTVVESYAELLKRWGKKKPEVLDEAIEAIHSEAVRMKSLTKQMLLLAGSDEEWKLDKQDTDLTALCRQTAHQLEKVYERQIRVTSDQQPFTVRVDPQKIRQLLIILLDNAIKYSDQPITVRTETKEENCSIAVSDQGMGIPSDDVPKVFDRFFRVDKVRSRETGGSGLGLSIARRIVRAHEGKIKLDSAEGVGTSVTVLLPIFNQEVS